jgi:hypothetical protein
MHCLSVLNCGWMRISVTSESEANWISFSPAESSWKKKKKCR